MRPPTTLSALRCAWETAACRASAACLAWSLAAAATGAVHLRSSQVQAVCRSKHLAVRQGCEACHRQRPCHYDVWLMLGEPEPALMCGQHLTKCVMGRCPGRAFAEAELAVVVALLLATYEMRLPSAPCGARPTAALCIAGVREAAGHGEPASMQPASALRRHDARRRPSSGDPEGLLPAPELRRQVGVRWPVGACRVHVVQRHTLHPGGAR